MRCNKFGDMLKNIKSRFEEVVCCPSNSDSEEHFKDGMLMGLEFALNQFGVEPVVITDTTEVPFKIKEIRYEQLGE